jgi:hypothetical protein
MISNTLGAPTGAMLGLGKFRHCFVAAVAGGSAACAARDADNP